MKKFLVALFALCLLALPAEATGRRLFQRQRVQRVKVVERVQVQKVVQVQQVQVVRQKVVVAPVVQSYSLLVQPAQAYLVAPLAVQQYQLQQVVPYCR